MVARRRGRMLVEDDAARLAGADAAAGRARNGRALAVAARRSAEMLPDTLDAFVAWRIGDAAPEAGWPVPRSRRTGPADAGLMIVTDMPEREDGDGCCCRAPAGRLFDRMLAAIGRDREFGLSAAARRGRGR